jgi:hypothetical protein
MSSPFKSTLKASSRKHGGNDDDVRWGTETADGRFLQRMVECGAANGMTAGEIQKKYPQTFGKYSNAKFTSALRRARIAAGVLDAPSPVESREVRFQNGKSRLIAVFDMTSQLTLLLDLVPRRTGTSSGRKNGGGNFRGMSDMMDNLHLSDDRGRLEEEDDITWASTPGMVVGESYSREIVASPSSIVNWYLMACWIDLALRRRVSFDLLLPSIPQGNIHIFVESGGWALIFRARLPEILLDVDKRNASFFDRQKEDDEEPLYGPSHCRTIAQKEAIRSLTGNRVRSDDPVYLTQSIRLPFQCEEVFFGCEEHAGLKFYATRDGTRMAVVELVKKAEAADNNNNHNFNSPAAMVEVDLVSFAGAGAMVPLNFGGRSIVSYGVPGRMVAQQQPAQDLPPLVQPVSQPNVPSMVLTRSAAAAIGSDDNNNNNNDNDGMSLAAVSWWEETANTNQSSDLSYQTA